MELFTEILRGKGKGIKRSGVKPASCSPVQFFLGTLCACLLTCSCAGNSEYLWDGWMRRVSLPTQIRVRMKKVLSLGSHKWTAKQGVSWRRRWQCKFKVFHNSSILGLITQTSGQSFEWMISQVGERIEVSKSRVYPSQRPMRLFVPGNARLSWVSHKVNSNAVEFLINFVVLKMTHGHFSGRLTSLSSLSSSPNKVLIWRLLKR